MFKPAPAYASLDPSLIRRPRLVPVDFVVAAPVAIVAPRWHEDLRFFVTCYLTGLVIFLFLLG